GNPGAVIAHADQPRSAALDVDLDVPGASVQAVLGELLDDGGRALDHLTGGDLVDELARKNANGHAGFERTMGARTLGAHPAVYQAKSGAAVRGAEELLAQGRRGGGSVGGGRRLRRARHPALLLEAGAVRRVRHEVAAHAPADRIRKT